ncbi:MAG: carbohydrate binding domain-containing protein [Kiritimatiellae bacterium]|nr:carbohydrate binding domain-containing protein [Kiritimatiellia bacterium]
MRTTPLRALGVAASLTIRVGASEPVPFAPPWDDTEGGVLDLRPVLAQSAASIRPVRVRNGRLVAGDRRVRLFGVNVTASACFPAEADAPKIAARMASFGINAVRFHFLDSTWGEPRLIRYESGSWTNWNPDALRRLDVFLHELKRQGIYWNINLLVGRRFGVGDGVDPAIQRLDWKAAHAVGFFHAPHLEAQKAYARRLLDRVNPLTGQRVADDPALAMVEINNENGLIHTWLSGDLDGLPEPFASDLQAQWNRWLAARYSSAEAMMSAWGARCEPPGPELLTNADFSAGATGWVLELHRGARAKLQTSNGLAVVRVENPADGGWAVQFNQPGFAVRRGGLYTVRFRVAADRPRWILANVMQAHEPWQSVGWDVRIEVKPEWTAYEFTFEAERDDPRVRFGFSDLAQAGAVFRFADLSVRPGGRIGPAEDERPERGTVRWPRRHGRSPLTDRMRRDWIEFLWDTERAHWTAMRKCLQQEIGVAAPVVGTVVMTSTPRLMGEFELVDTHAYWQHPRWTGRPWDPENWIVEPRSMVDAPSESTVRMLAWQRVKGRPHMVSEYNHPAPNPHAGEGPLMLATFGSLQDWDAIFLYTWAHGDDSLKAGRIPGYFDIGQHPTILANVRPAALAFRRGDVAAARTEVTAPWSLDRELDAIARHGYAWDVVGLARAGLPLDVALEHRVALDLEAGEPIPMPAAPERRRHEWLADTGQIEWRLMESGGGRLLVRSERFRAALGRIAGAELDLGEGLRVRIGPTRLRAATFAICALEGGSLVRAPLRAIVAATAYTENTGMRWVSPEMMSVGRQWGSAPSRIEPVEFELVLPGAEGALQPLDDRGRPTGTARELRGGAVSASGAATLWYELRLTAPSR